MNNELIEEIELELNLLIDMGFYNQEETFEIIEDMFYDEEIEEQTIKQLITDLFNKKTELETKWSDETDCDKLDKCFEQISDLGILTIHNAGDSIKDGVLDSIQVFNHLKDNDMLAYGFCFYHEGDIEEAIENKQLQLSFGDFEDDNSKYIKTGEIITGVLEDNGFHVEWNYSINERITIKPFQWQKRIDNKGFGMERSYDSFKEKIEKLLK